MWLLWIKQKGQGCDYTIDCGQTLITLRANNINEAREAVKEKLEFYGFLSDSADRELDFCKLYEAVEYDAKAHLAIQEAQTIANGLINKEKEEKEHVEYERLKNKFGN